MKIKFSKITIVSALCSLAIVLCGAVLKDDGIAGRTGSPGETNCTNCHKAEVNSGGGSIVINSDIPVGGYTLSKIYHITVTIKQTGVSLFGLGVEALNANNSNGGTLKVTNSSETKSLTSAGRTNIVHQLNGGQVNTAGTKIFVFDWKAPATDIGKVTFYVAGLAANGDTKDDAGDKTYTTTLAVNANSVAGIMESTRENQIDMAIFPNPAKEKVNLKYDLKKAGLVTISLHNSQGQLLTTLYSDIKTAGNYEEDFKLDGNYAAGIYFIKIKSDNYLSGKTLIIE